MKIIYVSLVAFYILLLLIGVGVKSISDSLETIASAYEWTETILQYYE